MSTKSNPGRFNCYAAALPDEPVFTILGRDPAYSATVRHWINERIRAGKTETQDDLERLAAADGEARAGHDWREANLNPLGEGPTWRLPRQIITDEPPICIEPILRTATGLEMLEGIRVIASKDEVKYDDWRKIEGMVANLISAVRHENSKPELEVQNQPETRETLRQAMTDLRVKHGNQFAREVLIDLGYESLVKMVADDKHRDANLAFVRAILKHVPAPVADRDLPHANAREIIDGEITVTSRNENPVNIAINRKEYLTFLREVRDALDTTPAQQVIVGPAVVQVGDKRYTVEELLPLVQQGEALAKDWHNADDLHDLELCTGVRTKIAIGLLQVSADMARVAKQFTPTWREPVLTFVDRINGHAAELAPNIDLAKFAAGQLGEMPEHMPEDRTEGEKVVINSEPEDLAHAPEVPPHRFSEFFKGEHYAYARGLEVNPVHLPTALDAMRKDGWELVSTIGQGAPNIGFVFKRTLRGFDTDHGFNLDRTVINTLADKGETVEQMRERFREMLQDTPVFTSGPLLWPSDRYRKDKGGETVTHQPVDLGFPKRGYKVGVADHSTSTLTLPKVEVHLEGMNPTDALSLMRTIECRLRWLPNDYETVQVVGLIAGDPEAAFDFTQHRSTLGTRKTLIDGDCGATEFGRQQEP